jgi:hypothetical protein
MVTTSAPQGPFTGGSGGGLQVDEALHATFPVDGAAGASVTAVQTSTGTPQIPPLPVSLGPGQALILNVGLTRPKANGYYTFGFSVAFDGKPPVHISTMEPTLFDTKAVRWGGQACTKPAMLQQIPTSNPDAKYVCPM